MEPKILRLNKVGTPLSWLTKQEAVTLWAKNQIIWSYNENNVEIRGGFDNQGQQTVIELPTILASEGECVFDRFTPPLENRFLFRRDGYMCLYCGKQLPHDLLSRDHVIPKSLGGKNQWSNVITACKRCNQRKADRTPEQAGMELLAIPFVPNKYEFMYLANHHILADQMEFLQSNFSDKQRWFG